MNKQNFEVTVNGIGITGAFDAEFIRKHKAVLPLLETRLAVYKESDSAVILFKKMAKKTTIPVSIAVNGEELVLSCDSMEIRMARLEEIKIYKKETGCSLKGKVLFIMTKSGK